MTFLPFRQMFPIGVYQYLGVVKGKEGKREGDPSGAEAVRPAPSALNHADFELVIPR